MDFNTVKDIVLYAILASVFLYCLFKWNILGGNRGTKKTTRERDEQRASQNKKAFFRWLMAQFEGLNLLIGGGLSKDKEFELRYKLDRCDIKVKPLDRRLKPTELNGIFRLVQFISIIITILAFSFSFSIVSCGWLVLCLLPKAFIIILDTKIQAEDEELEENFPDLYLLLYSRLIKGAHARILPTVQDYVNSLNEMYGNGKGHMAIRKFCSRFVANVEIYGDESMAIKKLRDHYHSPTIINFCNLAAQSLTGVNNADKLLGFKQELTDARKKAMQRYAERLVVKGNRAVYVVYVVLFEFIVLSWVSKIDLSLFSGLFG